MQRDSQLFSSNLDRIEKEVWYRQRFDACPHFMFFLGDAHISEIQHTKYPYGQRIAYAGFSKNRADWYHSLPELQYTASGVKNEAIKNPHVSKQMIQDFLPWQESFYDLALKLTEINLRDLSDEELLANYQELAEVYTKKLNSSPLIDGFALSTDEDIANQVEEFLQTIGQQDKFVEYFEILTSPTFLSFLQEEEMALLEAAISIKSTPEAKDVIIKKHQQNYFWSHNNYVKDNVLGVEYFANRIEEYGNIDYQDKIKEIKNLPEENKKRKQELKQQLQLPKSLETLLEITDDFNAWQDERKKGTFWATHYFSVLMEEFSRRTKYTVEQLKYAFPPEMADVLAQTIDPVELDQRIEYVMIIWTLDKYDYITDKALIDKLDKIGTGEYAHATELKGFAAQLGKVSGKVKIVESVEEISKVEEGDILVAVMTRPDYLPAMKKAAAFVTDEGGITCHAAIVARELKKPCIVGTKIATKTFKDGDMVEVDASNGVVKIIN